MRQLFAASRCSREGEGNSGSGERLSFVVRATTSASGECSSGIRAQVDPVIRTSGGGGCTPRVCARIPRRNPQHPCSLERIRAPVTAGRYYGDWKRARIYLVSVPYARLPVARLKCGPPQPPVDLTRYQHPVRARAKQSIEPRCGAGLAESGIVRGSSRFPSTAMT